MVISKFQHEKRALHILNNIDPEFYRSDNVWLVDFSFGFLALFFSRQTLPDLGNYLPSTAMIAEVSMNLLGQSLCYKEQIFDWKIYHLMIVNIWFFYSKFKPCR